MVCVGGRACDRCGAGVVRWRCAWSFFVAVFSLPFCGGALRLRVRYGEVVRVFAYMLFGVVG